jgi:hypothetical protein
MLESKKRHGDALSHSCPSQSCLDDFHITRMPSLVLTRIL